MKKPKIQVDIWKGYYGWMVDILSDDISINCTGKHPTKKAAREWARDWCRTVGAALMEKGK